MTKNATTISQGNQKLISYSNISAGHGQPWLKQVLFGKNNLISSAISGPHLIYTQQREKHNKNL